MRTIKDIHPIFRVILFLGICLLGGIILLAMYKDNIIKSSWLLNNMFWTYLITFTFGVSLGIGEIQIIFPELIEKELGVKEE